MDSRLISAHRHGLRHVALACGLVVSLGVAAARADDGVHPFRAHYEGKKKIALITATARAVIELQRSARFVRYTMNTTVSWAMLERRFRDCSVMRIDGDRLQALEYRHVDESQPGLDVHTRFDWDAGTATTVLGNAPQGADVPVVAPTWDPMSFQVALIALAPRRALGDAELHRVIERGVPKEHRVRFGGLAPLAGQDTKAYEIVSRKERGVIALHLLPEHEWRPLRVAVDDITIDLVGNPAGDAPSGIPDGEVPRCEPGTPRAGAPQEPR
jgi:hypothetical protein